MKVRFFTNIPSPYRIDFFNLLGEKVELEVIFEAEKAPKINSKWYCSNTIKNFNAIFLKKGVINEKRINLSILKYINKTVDVLIFTNYGYYTELFALIYAKIKKIKYGLEIDGGIISKNENIIKKILKKFLISNACFYFSPSKETDKFLIYYGAKKEQIYRYPFTSIYQREILKQPMSLVEKHKNKIKNNVKEEKVILTIGQFIYRKGFDWMIKAYKDLDKSIGIYIIGGKPTSEYLKLKEKYKMTNLHFIDFQNKESVLNWYRSADLFVLPTREDIWGLVINEALSQGLPVITTNKCIAGLELIEDGKNGYVIDVENGEMLLEKTSIFFSLSDQERKKIMTYCLNKIKKYTLENMSSIHFDILKNVDNIKLY